MSTSHLSLTELRELLSEGVWSERLAAAQAEADLLERVARRIAGGASRRAALVEVFPEVPESTVRRRLARFEEGGVDALIDRRRPGRSALVTLEVAAMVRGMLAREPGLRSGAMAKALAKAGHPIGGSTLRAFLAESGLSHPVGRPVDRPVKPRSLALAGTELLLGVEEELQAISQLSRAMGEALENLPESEGPVQDDSAHRDLHGRFLPEYNALRERTVPELGERFDSVEAHRAHKDLQGMRVATSSERARYRKDLTLTLLPMIVEGARWSELRHWRGALLEDLVGIAYQPATLDKHARELKLAGLAEVARTAVAAHWLKPGEETVDAVTGMVIAYCDVTTKPLWTHHFTRSTKVSSTGRVQPAVSTFFLHSGAGTPLLYRSFSGHVSVPGEVMTFLEQYEQLAGEGTLRRVVVLDRESHAAWLFKELNASKWLWVIPLRKQVVGDQARFEDQTPWVPYGNDGDEVCEAKLWLRDSRHPKEELQVRAVGRRRHRTAKVLWFATNSPEELMKPQDVVRIYFERWPLQEHVFRDGKGRVGLDRHYGYGKAKVTDVAIVDKIERHQAARIRQEEALADAEVALAQASGRCAELEKALVQVQAAVAEGTRCIEDMLSQGQHGGDAFRDAYKGTAERRREQAILSAQLDEAEALLDRVFSKQQAAKKAIARAEEEIARMEGRRDIFTVDTELDEIMSAYKLTFMNLARHLIRRHLQAPMELDTLIHGVLTLPGERIRTRTTETIRIFNQPRDPATMAAVQRACISLNALNLQRDNRKLRYEFVESP